MLTPGHAIQVNAITTKGNAAMSIITTSAIALINAFISTSSPGSLLHAAQILLDVIICKKPFTVLPFLQESDLSLRT